MIPTIESLEKDIARFQNNINESNELMELLADTAAALRKQTEAFEARSTELLEEMNGIPREANRAFSESFEAYLKEICAENQRLQNDLTGAIEGHMKAVSNAESVITSAVDSLEDRLDAVQKAHSAELARITTAHEAAVANATESYISKADECGKHIDEVQAEFARKVEAANIDKIYPLCQDLSKAVKSKLNLILGGVAVAAICSCISLILSFLR